MDGNSTDVNNATTIVANVTTTLINALNTTTTLPSTSTTPTTVKTTSVVPSSTMASTEKPVPVPTPFPAEDSASMPLLFFSFVLFLVAIALIAKVIVSQRKKRDLIGGSARWRLSASSQSGAPLQTDAVYAPVGRAAQQNRNPLDAAEGNRLDWERQFFDDHDASTQPPSRLRLDWNRV